MTIAKHTSKHTGYLLKRTQHLLRLTMDQKLAVCGLTASQYAALSMLEEHPGESNAGLAQKCFVTAQTMHQIVGLLEKRGMLERKAHPEHGKIQQLVLTRQGEKALDKAHKLVNLVEKSMTAALDQAELEQLDRALLKCISAME